MKKSIAEDLKKKYYKVDEISNFKELLYRSAEKFKTDIAFKLKDTKGKIYNVTYDEFKNDVMELGTSLINLNLQNKPIAVMGKNSYKWAVSYLAASIVGIVVPIDKELHYSDVINFLNVSDCCCIISDSKYLNILLENKNTIKNEKTIFVSMDNIENSSNNILNFDDIKLKGKELLDNNDNSFDNIKVNSDEMKILLFTSGTTGNAKGVCLSQRNIVSNIMSTSGIVKVTNKDQVLSILPLHHTYECTLGYLLVIYSGGCISYCEGLKYITKNISEFKPTIILCVPLLLENIYKKLRKILDTVIPKKYFSEENKLLVDKLPFVVKSLLKSTVKKSLGGKLRKFIVGAAPINPVIVETFFDFGIETLQGYGLTECAPLVAGNNDFYYKADSAGLPIPNVEYKIFETDSTGTGEIIARGPNIMLGYYKNEEDTKKVLVDGWFHTGDLGKIDDDGYLYITGRCKTVIITKNGKNIYPEEIEYYLNSSPLILEAIVIGADQEKGDDIYVHAQIVPDIPAISKKIQNKHPSDEEIRSAVSELIQGINEKLPNFKHIKKFTIRTEEFEKTTTRKIKRFGDNLKID